MRSILSGAAHLRWSAASPGVAAPASRWRAHPSYRYANQGGHRPAAVAAHAPPTNPMRLVPVGLAAFLAEERERIQRGEAPESLSELRHLVARTHR